MKRRNNKVNVPYRRNGYSEAYNDQKPLNSTRGRTKTHILPQSQQIGTPHSGLGMKTAKLGFLLVSQNASTGTTPHETHEFWNDHIGYRVVTWGDQRRKRISVAFNVVGCFESCCGLVLRTVRQLVVEVDTRLVRERRFMG
jgi:hypothetical protein